jgi:L-malate glycosyltransferase
VRLVLIGDGESPHLLKWARALSAVPGLELWAASSRGFAPGFDDAVPPARRLALGTHARCRRRQRGAAAHAAAAGALAATGAARLAASALPHLARHVGLAGAGVFGVPGRLAGSAWGSDILVTPDRGAVWRWLTQRVLRGARCAPAIHG